MLYLKIFIKSFGGNIMAFVDLILHGKGTKKSPSKKKYSTEKTPWYAGTVIYKFGNFGLFMFGIMLVAGLVAGARIYQGLYGFEYGLDSMSQGFQDYWMTLVKAELIGIFAFNIVVWSYLWFTRERDMDNVPPQLELKRYINLVLWILSYTFIVYWTTSYFAYADGAWHQTVLRDTSFTPCLLYTSPSPRDRG